MVFQDILFDENLARNVKMTDTTFKNVNFKNVEVDNASFENVKFKIVRSIM